MGRGGGARRRKGCLLASPSPLSLGKIGHLGSSARPAPRTRVPYSLIIEWAKVSAFFFSWAAPHAESAVDERRWSGLHVVRLLKRPPNFSLLVIFFGCVRFLFLILFACLSLTQAHDGRRRERVGRKGGGLRKLFSRGRGGGPNSPLHIDRSLHPPRGGLFAIGTICRGVHLERVVSVKREERRKGAIFAYARSDLQWTQWTPMGLRTQPPVPVAPCPDRGGGYSLRTLAEREKGGVLGVRGVVVVEGGLLLSSLAGLESRTTRHGALRRGRILCGL